MARTFDLTEVSESIYLNKEGMFDGIVTNIEPKKTKAGDDMDVVTIDTPEGEATVRIIYPGPNDPKLKMKMGFLKQNLRLLGLDVNGGEVDVADIIGNEVRIKVTASQYDVTDEMQNPTGEKRTSYNSQLVEKE